MKRIIYIMVLATLIGCQSASIRNGIERQLKEYPESRVLDLYKCFCQDNLGPEHLIPNPQTAADYLASELTEYSHDLASHKYSKPTLRYFATGDEGNYIRVDLSVVIDGYMTADEYLDAFVRSANQGTKRTTEQWKAKWAVVERCIRKHYMTIPDADKDLQEIKSLMDEGHFIIHHSEVFGSIYNPHYRIIAKDIFESEILPRINKTGKDMNSALELTQEWDKVFPQSDKVYHKKVTFRNRYGIELAADMYTPKNAQGKLAAIAVSGPFGAVKEQVSGLYAQTMAERGFLTIAFDPSYTGESGGEPRRTASPDINTEDFLAAVDFLSIQNNVNPERIGIIGICGFGGMAVNAAALDPRIKATVANTMYDMSRQISNNYNDAEDDKAFRDKQRLALAEARTQIALTGDYGRGGGVPKPEDLPAQAPQFLKEYADFYSTPRGFHPRSGGSTDGWNLIGCQSFLNQPLLCYAHEITNPVLLIHGEKAHSRYFSETAFEKMTGKTPEIPANLGEGNNMSIVEGNKEFYIVAGAVHTALYDNRAGVIPYDKMESFFKENLK